MPAPFTVVVATGLPPEATCLRPEYEQPDLTLSFCGPGRNFALDTPEIAAALGGAVPPRWLDLLEVAAAVYAADVAFLRGENEDWVRSTRFLIPVRDPAFWRDAEPQLALALYVLSHDSYTFDFRVREGSAEAPREPARMAGADCVALLSGGIDSFAGAAMLLGTGRRPVFVAHRPQNPMVVASQEHVRRWLEQTFGAPLRCVAAACGPARGRESGEVEEELRYPYPPPAERETSQRTRSFLYMALGALACRACGAEQLICPENGVLAVNVPLTSARVGGYSTAGARPQTLVEFRRLIEALGLSLSVDNPFLYQTKGQLVGDILRRYFPPEAVQGTLSCWMTGRLSRPCGTCVPCLVRAVAMHTAGLPPEAHAADPFQTGAEAGPDSAARANLVDLLTLAGRFQRLTDAELLRAYPLLLELTPEVSLPGVLQMLRRFAAEAHAALGS